MMYLGIIITPLQKLEQIPLQMILQFASVEPPTKTEQMTPHTIPQGGGIAPHIKLQEIAPLIVHTQ